MDQERLFRQSAYGQRLLSEIDAEGDTLATENRRIEQELTAEERALTEARATLAPSEFRARAEAFDEKVRRLRAEQDAKARALAVSQEEVRAAFVRRVTPILGALLEETGAAVLLDRRMVLSARAETDLTDRAIARIDAAVEAEGTAPSPQGDATESGQTPADPAE